MTRRTFVVALVAVVAVALALRLPRLDERPVHGDEAVHFLKFEELWHTGVYHYDPADYHGPTLYYLSMPAYALGGGDFGTAHAATFRLASVLAGVALLLLTALLHDALGRGAVLGAALLTAVSPAFVYYSRYYIQEMLLVCFTLAALACGWRYVRSARCGWAVGAGAAIGLMHATKETCVIAWAAAAAGLIVTRLTLRGSDIRPPQLRHLFVALAVAIGVSVTLMTGFFSNPRGALDSLLTYGRYLHRAAGAGLHDHPWYYYLNILLGWRAARGPWWSEGLIIGLAIVGAATGLSRRKDSGPARAGAPGAHPAFLRWLTTFTVAMLLVYSLIPYKTPWCLLGFLQGMLLLAGIGSAALVQRAPRAARSASVLLLLIGTAHLGWQSWRAAGPLAADPRNPYAYAHPVADVVRLGRWVELLAATHPDHQRMLVQVVADDCWPLPWYLRRLERVGYWTTPPESLVAPLVISSEELENAVAARLMPDTDPAANPYRRYYYGQRPGVVFAVFVAPQLWESYVEANRATTVPARSALP